MESEEDNQTANPPNQHSPPINEPEITESDVICHLALPFGEPAQVLANLDLILQLLAGTAPISLAALDSLFSYIVQVSEPTSLPQVNEAACECMDTLIYQTIDDDMASHWIKTILPYMAKEQDSICLELLLRYLYNFADNKYHHQLILSLDGPSILAQVVSRHRDLLGPTMPLLECICRRPVDLSSQQLEVILELLTSLLLQPNCEPLQRSSCLNSFSMLFDVRVANTEDIFPDRLLPRLIESAKSPVGKVVKAACNLASQLIHKSPKYLVKLFELGLLEHIENAILNLWDVLAISAYCRLIHDYLQRSSEIPWICAWAREKLHNTPLVERLKELLQLGGQYSSSILSVFSDMLKIPELRHSIMDDLLFRWVVARLNNDVRFGVDEPLNFIRQWIEAFKEQETSDIVVYELNRHGCMQALRRLTMSQYPETTTLASSLLDLAHAK